MQVVPTKKLVKRSRVVSQARLDHVDTGKRAIVDVLQEDGSVVKEERPIYHKVMVPAQYVEEEILVDIWAVTDAVGDVHEFADKVDADKFIGGRR